MLQILQVGGRGLPLLRLNPVRDKDLIALIGFFLGPPSSREEEVRPPGISGTEGEVKGGNRMVKFPFKTQRLGSL